MEFLQVSVTTTTEFSDLVALCLIENGSEGVNVSDYNDVREVLERHNWDYADDTLLRGDDGRVFVCGFFEDGFDVSAIVDTLQAMKNGSELATGSLEVSVKRIASAVWENEWRKYYAPIELDKIVIVPEWIHRVPDDKIEVRLDPGMAFGTGSHETTALCIRLMQDFDLSNLTVADVGCGSGILGIAALKLGAKKCLFVDIDPLAVRATHENCVLNGVDALAEIHQGDLLDHISVPPDFAVANITADILLKLLPEINAALKPDAGLVISGLIHSRAEAVMEAYGVSFELLRRVSDGEWQAASFRKRR